MFLAYFQTLRYTSSLIAPLSSHIQTGCVMSGIAFRSNKQFTRSLGVGGNPSVASRKRGTFSWTELKVLFINVLYFKYKYSITCRTDMKRHCRVYYLILMLYFFLSQRKFCNLFDCFYVVFSLCLCSGTWNVEAWHESSVSFPYM